VKANFPKGLAAERRHAENFLKEHGLNEETRKGAEDVIDGGFQGLSEEHDTTLLDPPVADTLPDSEFGLRDDDYFRRAGP